MIDSLLKLAAAAAAALAFSAAPALAATDFTGSWTLQGDPMAAPPAPSTPAAARKVKELMEARGLDAPNGSPEYARIWCTPEGMPAQHAHTLPILVAQSSKHITFGYPTEFEPRHIYLNGQPHPDPDVYDFQSVGHAIGRWQGDALVVDVRYFKEGILVIPGGALRTENSHLVERWRLTDPNTLQITYTWTDRETLRRPHTYTYVYKRAAGPVWMTEPQCNPTRAMRQKGLYLPFDAPE